MAYGVWALTAWRNMSSGLQIYNSCKSEQNQIKHEAASLNSTSIYNCCKYNYWPHQPSSKRSFASSHFLKITWKWLLHLPHLQNGNGQYALRIIRKISYLSGVQQNISISHGIVKVDKKSQQKRDTQQRKQGCSSL